MSLMKRDNTKLPVTIFIAPRPELLEKAKKLGLATFVIHQNLYFTNKHALFSDYVLLENFTKFDVVLKKIWNLRNSFKFIGVVSNVEQGVLLAQMCSDLLKLKGNGSTISSLLKDKLLFREYLNKNEEYYVPFGKVSSLVDLKNYARKNGYPFVVKPSNGSASLCIYCINNEFELKIVGNKIEEMLRSTTHRYAEYFPLNFFMAERYISGDEYSIEAVTHNGEHQIVAITQKLKNNRFIEIGHLLPANLSLNDTRIIHRFVLGFLDFVGFKSGPSHTEIIIENGRPFLVESHDRTGGDRIVDLVALASDVDLESFSILEAIGGVGKFPFEFEYKQFAATKFILSAQGRITSIRGLEKAKDINGIADVVVTTKIGDVISDIDASWDRSGQIIATGVSAVDALTACQKAIDAIQIEVS